MGIGNFIAEQDTNQRYKIQTYMPDTRITEIKRFGNDMMNNDLKNP